MIIHDILINGISPTLACRLVTLTTTTLKRFYYFPIWLFGEEGKVLRKTHTLFQKSLFSIADSHWQFPIFYIDEAAGFSNELCVP